MDGLRAELALDDQVGFREPGIEVASDMALQRCGVRRVDLRAGNPVGRVVPPLVKNGSARRDGVLDVRDGRERLVVYLDKLNRLLGDVRVARRHSRDRMSFVQHLALSEDGVPSCCLPRAPSGPPA